MHASILLVKSRSDQDAFFASRILDNVSVGRSYLKLRMFILHMRKCATFDNKKIIRS